jgi:hypothetical protein
MTSFLTALLGLVPGAILGRRLAASGLTAQNALIGRQRLAYATLVGVGAAGALIYYSYKVRWLPDTLVLYGEVAFLPATQLVAGFAIGLLLLLEWPGRRDSVRRRQLIAGTAILVVGWGFLAYRSLPIASQLAESLVIDGVVMQTSSYTCAPASIATLARHLLQDTTVTERQAAVAARTTRGGTHTLGEIRAMRALGLEPEFRRQLNADSLVAREGLALLHVDEPQPGGRTIRHAVALLEIHPNARMMTLGNPLYGRQMKSFDDLDGYWLGEAVFATVANSTTNGD